MACYIKSEQIQTLQSELRVLMETVLAFMFILEP